MNLKQKLSSITPNKISNYSISFKSSAAKELRKLSSELQQRVAKVIEKLVENPRFSGVVKLKGNNNLYRCRVGEYRMIYKVSDVDQKIVITRIRHRRDVYR